MNLFTTQICLVLTMAYVGIIYCLQVIPERAYILYANSKYVENASVEVKRYGRNSPYYFNARGVIKHTWGNNVSVDVETYDFLNNEYKRSFVEFHGQICNLLKSEIVLIRAIFDRVGLPCPIPKGLVQLINLTLSIENFPYEFPHNRALLNFSFFVTNTMENIGYGHLYVNLKHNIRKKH